MRTYLILLFTIPTYTFATAPECPGYKTKKACLAFVDDTFNKSLEFIDENFMDAIEKDEMDKKQELIQASLDIKKFETLACHKTCLN